MSSFPPPRPTATGSSYQELSPPPTGDSPAALATGETTGAGQPDEEPRDDRSPLIPILVGLVIFLAALILVVKFGPRLRPTLAEWLGRTPRQALTRQIERLKKDGPREGRLAAARELVKLGDDAVIAALDATNSVSGTDYSAQFSVPVWQAFAEVGTDSMPALLKAAQSPQENVRTAAVGTLRELGPAAEPAMDLLAPLVKDKNRWVAGFACDTLGNVGSKASVAAIDALCQVVQQPESTVRRRAIVALGRIGPPARSATPVLKQVRQGDDDKDIREAAAVALNEIDLRRMIVESTKHADAEVRELIHRLQGKDNVDAIVAARSLGKRGAGAKAAVPALAAALAAPDKWLREAAAEALGAIGPDSRNVLPALQRAVNDKEPEVHDAAQKALEKIGS